jgi:adenine C2-methylase RlmN of 23S rRNA A2503 and tRNA A37
MRLHSWQTTTHAAAHPLPAPLQRVSNVVFMGMGEPLLNLPSVLRAQQVLNQEMGIGGL